MNYNDIEPASEEKIQRYKKIALSILTHRWYDTEILSLIKVIEQQKQEIEDLKYEVVAAASMSW